MSRPTRTVGEPHDRLTRLCGAMTDALEAHPERGREKCVIFLSDDVERRRGLQLHGYDDDAEAVFEVLLHLRKVFEANGKTLIVAPIGGDG